MGIQSSINSALGTVAGAGAIKKYIGGQKEIKDNVKDVQMTLNEGNEIKKQEELSKIDQAIGMNHVQMAQTQVKMGEGDRQLNKTENDAMKAIDDYYNAQESGKMTDKQAYEKALQTYKDKIESINRQNEGRKEFYKQLIERRKLLQGKKDDVLGGIK